MKDKFIFEKIKPFKDGFAAVKHKGLWGVINNNGKFVIKPSYESLSVIGSNLFIAKKNGLYGVINKDNGVIVPFKYDLLDFLNSENLLIAKFRNLYGVINSFGEIIIPSCYENVSKESNDNYIIVMKNNKWGVINKYNQSVIPIKYDHLELGRDFVLCKQDGNYGVLNFENNVLIPFEYRELVSFSEGKDISMTSIKDNPTFCAELNGKNIVIDIHNQKTSNTLFDNILPDGTKIYGAKIGNTYCVIDRFGNIKIPKCKYDNLYLYYECTDGELLTLAYNEKQQEGIINQNEETVIPFDAGYKTDGYMYVKGNNLLMRKNDKFGVIDRNNQVIIPFEYDWLFYENDNFSGGEKNGKWGYIDNYGKTLKIKRQLWITTIMQSFFKRMRILMAQNGLICR